MEPNHRTFFGVLDCCNSGEWLVSSPFQGLVLGAGIFSLWCLVLPPCLCSLCSRVSSLYGALFCPSVLFACVLYAAGCRHHLGAYTSFFLRLFSLSGVIFFKTVFYNVIRLFNAGGCLMAYSSFSLFLLSKEMGA